MCSTVSNLSDIVLKVMSKQPETKQIVKKFVWCQWDCQHQQLYYIYYRSPGARDQNKDNPVSMMSAIQFYLNAEHENIVSFLVSISVSHLSSCNDSDFVEIL